MKRAIILVLVTASGVALFLVTDLESMSSAILSMPGEMFVALVALLIGNEVLKGLRWAYFLRASQLDIRTVDGLTSYLAAQAATAVPGGSVLSARLAQEHGHVRMYQAAAGLVGQGIADICALAILSTTAILLTEQRSAQLLIPVAATLVALMAVGIIRSERLANWLSTVLARWRLSRRFLPQEEDFRGHSVRLMRPRTLGIGATYSIATTLCSALILLTITEALTERGMSTSEALYTHSLSTVARMVLPVPGGFGVSDASLTGLLNFIGIGLGRATFIALSYRSVGLLFRTMLGLLVLIVRYPYILIGPKRVPQVEPARARWRLWRWRFSPQRSPANIPSPNLVVDLEAREVPGRAGQGH